MLLEERKNVGPKRARRDPRRRQLDLGIQEAGALGTPARSAISAARLKSGGGHSEASGLPGMTCSRGETAERSEDGRRGRSSFLPRPRRQSVAPRGSGPKHGRVGRFLVRSRRRADRTARARGGRRQEHNRGGGTSWSFPGGSCRMRRCSRRGHPSPYSSVLYHRPQGYAARPGVALHRPLARLASWVDRLEEPSRTFLP